MNSYTLEHIKTLSDIEDIPYEGYYWVSDEDAPKMLFGGADRFPKEKFIVSLNPFCVEALLYSKEKNVTIHIQHTGSYLVNAFDLSRLPGDSEDKFFLPHKLDRVKKVCFKQIWEEMPIEEGSGMLTLTPTALIFSGFKY